MKRFFLPCFFIFCLFSVSADSFAGEQAYSAAPTVLPNVTRAMKTPGYWISRHPSPDQLLLTSEGVQRFNTRVKNDLNLAKDILQLPEQVSGVDLRASLEKVWSDFKSKNYFAGDKKASASFYDDIKKQMNLEGLPEQVPVRFGFIVHLADQRFFPTGQGLFEKKNDIYFDELQNSDLDIGTPAAVVHHSLDGGWLYVLTNMTDGWVKTENVALAAREQVAEFFNARPGTQGGVIVSAKADIFLDEQLTEFYDYARMGTPLPIQQISEIGFSEVSLPLRMDDGNVIVKTVYIKSEDIHKGFLPYTPRRIIEQAFKMLNAPYGWGGMNGEQDCSRFLAEVFGTFGMHLPRNSKEQAQAGRPVARFDIGAPDEKKLKALRDAAGGVTVLPMKGHIMIYLGMADDRPYAIHAVWAYRQPGKRKDAVRVINRVAVTDLFLGEGSQKGSLLKRLNAVVLMAQ